MTKMDKLEAAAVANETSSSDKLNDEKSRENSTGVHYKVEDIPPWYLCMLLGFQHYLTMFGGTITFPTILAPKLCMSSANPARAYLISTTFFVSGIATVLQASLGARLPIIQGVSFTFLVPTLAVLNLPEWSCPTDEEIINSRPNATGTNAVVWLSNSNNSVTEEERKEIWEKRMREIQGAIIVASLIEIFLGATGLVGYLLKLITPVAIAPVIALIGLSLFHEAAENASTHWGVSIGTMALLIIFCQYCEHIQVPILTFSRSNGIKIKKFPLFKLFPVLMTIIIAWIVCGIVTVSDAVPAGSKIRTDTKLTVMDDTPWIRVPSPFQWGLPTVSLGAVCGLTAGVFSSIIESIGDYYACAKISGAPPPPDHAINRGITVEGIGCLFAGMFGSGNGLTSFSENIGAIGVTKVASRRVIQWGGLLMIGFGIIGKFASLFVILPEPVLGGIFIVMFSMVAGVGLSNMQYINVNSSRNVFIVGFSILTGLMFPDWMKSNPGAINTGSTLADQLLMVLCSTGIFVAGLVGIFLDNTIPGTEEDRGITKWKMHGSEPESKICDCADNSSTTLTVETVDLKEAQERCYNLPFFMTFIRRYSVFTKLPISPTYQSL